jgi:S-adenosylmethionine-diacylglycerol 3-amino-3-carboxypropyl transferase
VYLTGQYAKDCCPDYLTKEGFAKLKHGAVNRVSIHTQTIEEVKPHPLAIFLIDFAYL